MLGGEGELLGFDGVRGKGLHFASGVKGGAEDEAICGLEELDRAVGKRDADTIAHDNDVFRVRGFGRIHRRTGKRVPNSESWRSGRGSLRESAACSEQEESR